MSPTRRHRRHHQHPHDRDHQNLYVCDVFEPRKETKSAFQTKCNVTSPRRQVTEVKTEDFPFVMKPQKREKKSKLYEPEIYC